MKPKTAGERVRYAKQFVSVLQTGDASPLLELSPNKRIHCMKGLASLAHFTGKTELWNQIRKTYGLTWSTGTEQLDAFTRFFDSSRDLDTMLSWVKQAIKVLPPHMGEIIKLNCLLGVRPSECIEAVRLIRNPETFKTLYNEQRQTLEYFRFRDIFVRRTKTAWISIITKGLLSGIVQTNSRTPTPTYETLRFRLERNGVQCHMSWCRKIFTSHLIQSAIDANTVDMLQGRCPQSILLRYYQVPDSTLPIRVLTAVEKLRKEIES
jgi:hypothetical protein